MDGGEVTPIQITDLRLFEDIVEGEQTRTKARPVSESEVLSLFTDDDLRDEMRARSPEDIANLCTTDELVGELVKRGVLVEQANEFGRPFRLFAVGEPVGSVGETPPSYRYEVVDGVKVPRLIGELPVNPPGETP